MSPGTIFAKGEIINSPEGINITNSRELLRWIAVRGRIYDWTIYCHLADKSYEWIRRHGDKVFEEENIKKLVFCDEDAFKMYRF